MYPNAGYFRGWEDHPWVFCSPPEATDARVLSRFPAPLIPALLPILALTKARLHLHLPRQQPLETPLLSQNPLSPFTPPPKRPCNVEASLSVLCRLPPDLSLWLLTAAPARPPLTTLTRNSCSGPGAEMRVAGESEQTGSRLPPYSPPPTRQPTGPV